MRETKKLLKELTKSKRHEEVDAVKEKILERLDKKVDDIKQLIRQRKD
ncbi:MAG: hypothetical protein AB1797_12015 [bacterium]